ncbi:MAG: hypothetical protein AAF646_15320 [Pseudomonadota bacterium]
MVVIAAALFGAALGAWRARARGGSRADMVQYGAAHAIAFGLLGLFAAIALDAYL